MIAGEVIHELSFAGRITQQDGWMTHSLKSWFGMLHDQGGTYAGMMGSSNFLVCNHRLQNPINTIFSKEHLEASNRPQTWIYVTLKEHHLYDLRWKLVFWILLIVDSEGWYDLQPKEFTTGMIFGGYFGYCQEKFSTHMILGGIEIYNSGCCTCCISAIECIQEV